MRCCFITLGCRVNQYESDAMAELIKDAGYELTDDPAKADVCVVNTCTVTNIADRKSRQMLSKAHRLNERAKLVVCGCFAQRRPEEAGSLAGVDAVIGSSDKGRIVEIVNSLFSDEDEKSEKTNFIGADGENVKSNFMGADEKSAKPNFMGAEGETVKPNSMGADEETAKSNSMGTDEEPVQSNSMAAEGEAVKLNPFGVDGEAVKPKCMGDDEETAKSNFVGMDGEVEKSNFIGADDEEKKPKVFVRDVMHEHEFEELSAVREGRTRAYLKIQDGCNMFCTYCAIPFARGAIRSRSLSSVRREAEKLNEGGYAEVVLTGIHLMSYGRDLPERPNILDAIACFDGLENIKRIRLGSLEPHLMSDEIIEGLAENPRICKQFHLSLQSGSTTVLSRMKRGYTADEYYELCQKLRSAFGEELAVTTDIIAGFPGETRAEHEETIAFIEKVEFSKVHVFPYSRRSGTLADKMKNQLSNAEKSARARELISKGKSSELEFLSRYLGKEVNVLIESDDGESSFGYTDNYIRMRILSAEPINRIVCAVADSIEQTSDGELRLTANVIA